MNTAPPQRPAAAQKPALPLSRGPIARPQKAVIYGPEGVGKSTRLVGGPELEKEYRFDPTRRWRADVAHLRKNCLTEDPHCQSLKANPFPGSKNA
jgi:hypothetical protein